MEKLNTAVLEYPRMFQHNEDLLKKVHPDRPARGRVSADKRHLFTARDRLFSLFENTADGRTGKTDSTGETGASAELVNKKARVMLDLGDLGYKVSRKEEELGSWAHYKIGIAKMLHTYDSLYSRTYRDLMKDVLAMNKASNLVYSSPKNLMDSMRGVMASMKSFVGMLQPMSQVMGRMNEINQNIVKIGHEIGPEGANKVFRELREKIESYPDLAGSVSQIGRSGDRPDEELNVGRFYQDWTADCLLQGVQTLQYAGSLVEKHVKKLKTLALLSRTAREVNERKKEPRSFNLPSSFATKEKDRESQEKRDLGDIEQELSRFADVNRLEMEIPDIMSSELLNDPYMLATESIAQASLTRDITGLDDSSRLTTQTHGAMF